MNIDSKKHMLAERLGAIEQQTTVSASKTPKLDNAKVAAAFKDFKAKPLPKLDHYELDGETVIVEVFAYWEKSSLIASVSGENFETRHTFPIGKVLASGSSSKYPTGTLVKLKDYDTSTIPNPRYEAWVNNPHSKSNMSRVGEEPAPYLENLWAAHSSKLFRLNPLKQELTETDWLTFKFADAHIECKINENALAI